MPKYHVHGTVVGGKYLGVYEAETAEKAVEAALNECCVSMCHQCAEECEDPEISSATAEEIKSDGQG